MLRSSQALSPDGNKSAQSYSQSSFFVIILKGRHSIDRRNYAKSWTAAEQRLPFDNRIITVDII